jgi:arginine/lysine/ornithine decarboxylase
MKKVPVMPNHTTAFIRRQSRSPLFEAVTAYRKRRPGYFCIPGHRYERGISELWRREVGDAVFSYDLTEASGLDDLHAPEGAIREAQMLLTELYGAAHSYFLVNGSTCGNEAMLLAALSPGDRVLVPRNAHKSILMGLVLSGAVPVWILPEYLENYGLWGGVKPQTVAQALDEHPDCRAVCLVSPTYQGFCSNLQAIADICHSRDALLLVDEAHGGHLYFSEKFPRGALRQGADLCVQSFHKVTGALTQSSVLHIGSDRLTSRQAEAALKLVQSSSPSYLLMISLDLARRELALHGPEQMDRLYRLSQKARDGLNAVPGIKCPGLELTDAKIPAGSQNTRRTNRPGGQAGPWGIAGLDPSRLVIHVGDLGIEGDTFRRRLFDRHNIDLEMAEGDTALAVLTTANTEEDVEDLLNAVRQTAKESAAVTTPQTDGRTDTGYIAPSAGAKNGAPCSDRPAVFSSLPPTVFSPREAWFAPKQAIPWEKAAGRIAGEALIPYPPGIPMVYPGELLTPEIWNYADTLRRNRRRFHGPADPSLTTFQIIDRR